MQEYEHDCISASLLKAVGGSLHSDGWLGFGLSFGLPCEPQLNHLGDDLIVLAQEGHAQ